MAYARRTDRPHAVIRDTFRKAGWFVLDTSRVPCFVDCVIAKHGRVHFVEIKDGAASPSRRLLTPAQVKLHGQLQAAGVSVIVVTSIDEALSLTA